MAVGAIVFGCTFGGALLGMVLRALLPEHHMSHESKDVVKLGTGLIGTLSALVLGLLIASAKSSFDAQRTGFQQLAARRSRNPPSRGPLPTPFLVVVVFWLSVLFLSFGLFAPPNPTVIVTLLVCSLSVAGAMFLIVDLDDPFGGLIQISSNSLRNAVSQMGH